MPDPRPGGIPDHAWLKETGRIAAQALVMLKE